MSFSSYRINVNPLQTSIYNKLQLYSYLPKKISTIQPTPPHLRIFIYHSNTLHNTWPFFHPNTHRATTRANKLGRYRGKKTRFCSGKNGKERHSSCAAKKKTVALAACTKKVFSRVYLAYKHKRIHTLLCVYTCTGLHTYVRTLSGGRAYSCVSVTSTRDEGLAHARARERESRVW